VKNKVDNMIGSKLTKWCKRCDIRLWPMGELTNSWTSRQSYQRATYLLRRLCLRYRNKAILFTSSLLRSSNSTFHLSWPRSRERRWPSYNTYGDDNLITKIDSDGKRVWPLSTQVLRPTMD